MFSLETERCALLPWPPLLPESSSPSPGPLCVSGALTPWLPSRFLPSLGVSDGTGMCLIFLQDLFLGSVGLLECIGLGNSFYTVVHTLQPDKTRYTYIRPLEVVLKFSGILLLYFLKSLGIIRSCQFLLLSFVRHPGANLSSFPTPRQGPDYCQTF